MFALSLPFPLLEGDKAKQTIEVIEQHLVTPVGLRSLSPADTQYLPACDGDQQSRDSAYHQGTVWSWLIGPYVSAIINVEGSAGRKKARKVYEGLIAHLNEAGIGSLSEIFDGDAPHTPRGCIAQAWSVGESLRGYLEDVMGVKPKYDGMK